MKLTKQQQYILAGSALALVMIGVISALLLGGEKAGTATVEEETTATAEATWTVEPTETAEPGEAEETPSSVEELVSPTQPSYVRFAYVRRVGGLAGNYTVDLDFFDIYTEDAAESYAKEHGLSVPGNGILYVDDDSEVTNVPLKTDVVIIYKTGGVESLEQKFASVEQLREWANENYDAMPDAMTDMWQVTVEQGIATRIEMVVLAD